MKLCDENQCTGCGACVTCCPKEALELVREQDAFLHPVVDTKRCIDCKMCETVCPVLNPPIQRAPNRVYAAFLNDQEERRQCASGGAASAAGKAVLQKGGVVYGVALEDGIRAAFRCAHTEEELLSFRNSKYVESFLGTTYRDIREKLKQGETVLFVGLPCQVAGLQKVIPENLKEKLFTMDLICHGVPSGSFLACHMKENYGDNAQIISFRDVNANFFLKIKKGRHLVNWPAAAELYYKTFIEGYSYRRSCYQCQFARKERVSDVTVGDFWGLGDRIPYSYDRKKVSLILENTPKGNTLLRAMASFMQIDERTWEEAALQNAQLSHPSAETELSEIFRRNTEQYGSVRAAQMISGASVCKEKLHWKLACIKRKILHRSK